MKKILPFLLLAFATLFVYSCDNRDNNNTVDSDTFPKMTDVTGTFTSANNYGFTQNINIQSTDVVLVYRRDVNSNNAWQLIPKTYFLSAGRELDYNALFSSQQVEVYIDPSFDLSTMTSTEANQFLNNQTFRIVLVPAAQAKGTNAVDYNDYTAVIKYYNLDDSKVASKKFN
ncbi:hypothetical protein [Chryseobacterium fistulae]|uniref:DUF1735 domain-containing protein n=1 Tax=Chryseobacterium fistulae TaxID=2675058 RepID=A0A6N4XVD7_9FLAO|nr:hypothetical protein [Chryseobacterium fistulae]CAA7390107.1 hypothetical protein CHRY9393_02405 [Chryseobacterium fistulae]